MPRHLRTQPRNEQTRKHLGCRKVLRCAWHIVNRAMYRIFGSASRDWQRAFEKIFWIWQGVETLDALKAFYDWIMNSFFTSPVIIGDMSPSDISKLDSFLGGIWATRNQWSVAHNLEVQAFDLRVNTFTEAQFSVLTQHVGVSASMSAPTFVRAEDLVQLHRQNKLMLQNFKQSTRSYSHTTKAKEWFVAVEELFCPKPLKMQKQEVELASECLRSARTKVKICRGDMCPTCTKYMTPRQKTLKEISQETITIHAQCHVLDPKKKVTFASLPTEFQNEIRKAPKEKNWRVVTCHKYQNGWLILCSCGWSMRNMLCCLHCSMVVQMSTNFEFCGCEEESLSIRHTHAYAGIQV